MNSMKLTVDIQSYWHAGTGQGSGHHLDALVATDRSGIPYLPGKTLRGLLRDAVWRLECWGSLPALIPTGTTVILFGSTPFSDESGAMVSRDVTVPGSLYISNATLPDEVCRWLATDGAAEQRSLLFREHLSTAVEPSGVAKPHSLRGIQVTVPLMLEAEASLLRQEASDSLDWQAVIQQAMPLIRAVGSHRSRGFGRCTLAAKEAGNA